MPTGIDSDGGGEDDLSEDNPDNKYDVVGKLTPAQRAKFERNVRPIKLVLAKVRITPTT